MNEKVNALKKTSMFSQLSQEEVNEVVRAGKTKSYAKGSIIFSQGQPAIAAYIVITGKVKVYKLSPDGRQYILHIFKSGELFAESAMFAGTTYPAFAQALEKTNLFYLLKNDFIGLLENKPSLALKMLASQAVRLREFASKIEDLSLKEVAARLAGYIVEQVNVAGRQTEEGFRIDLPMNKSQLAAYLGTISETLSRTLASFKNKVLIEEIDNKIIVKNLDKLKIIAKS